MPTLSIILLLISAAASTMRDFMTKQASHKLVFVWWMSLISALLLMPFSIYFIWQTQPPLEAYGFAILMGAVHASYWTFYSKAYEKGDISHVYPIIHSAPAFVLIFGMLFLQEHPSLLGIIGILIVTAGVYIINIKNLSWRNLFDPLRAIVQESHTQFAFLALMVVVIYSIMDKVAVSKLHPLIYAFINTLSALCIFSIFIRKHLKNSWLQPLRTDFKKVVAGAIFADINYSLILFALQLTNASYVSGFRQVSVIFAVLLGVVFLKEKVSKLRIFSACLIFIGAFLIAL